MHPLATTFLKERIQSCREAIDVERCKPAPDDDRIAILSQEERAFRELLLGMHLWLGPVWASLAVWTQPCSLPALARAGAGVRRQKPSNPIDPASAPRMN